MKTAVIGLGIGMAHAAGYLAHPEAQLTAVADAWSERRASVNGTFSQGAMQVLKPLFEPPEAPADLLSRSWEELGCRVYEDAEQVIADPEIELVSLCTPDDTHEELALRLLSAGKHLLLEKPLALSAEGARRIGRALEDSKGRLSFGYEFRVNPAVRELRRLVKKGELGCVRAFALYHFRTPFRRNKWQQWIQKKDRSGGLLVEETCHWFDLARYITGREVVELNCVGTGDIHADFDYEDLAFVQGRFDDDAVFQISHALTGHDFSLILQLHGTEGTAWCGLKEEVYSSLDGGSSDYLGLLSFARRGDAESSVGALQVPGPEDAIISRWGREATEPWNIRQYVMETVDALQESRPFPAEYEDGLRSLEIALAARRSLERGKAVLL